MFNCTQNFYKLAFNEFVACYFICFLYFDSSFFQEEEIEALAAIYGDEWVAIDSELRKYHIKISDEKSQNIILMEVGKKKKGSSFWVLCRMLLLYFQF